VDDGDSFEDLDAREPGLNVRRGILAGFLGMAIAISQVRGFIVFVLIFLVLWIKLRMEEQWMRSQFGETYATYAHQTAALVPYLL
jgi:protein-S-isoprenylcysteine O-methyltransferase Ste14